MTDVDRLLNDYVAEHRAGGEADPLEYLSRLEGTDRQELAALIDSYLASAPRREWDAAAFESSSARRVSESLERSLLGVSGMWPSLLPRLRERARLKRSEVVSRLAEALGFAGQREKVGLYYHEMEQGLLPAEGVSSGVLQALGEIFGQSAEALREAGAPLRPQVGREIASQEVFARTARPDAEYAEAEPTSPEQPPGPQRPEEWDEVDRAFRGGG
jgi:hypothetical protein